MPNRIFIAHKRTGKVGEALILSIVRNTVLSPIYRVYGGRLLRQVQSKPPPVHIGFILDGNRRFAAKKGVKAHLGHYFGANKVEELLEWCLEARIKVVTMYAFSTENAKRADEEVSNIMELAKERFAKLVSDERIHKNRVRVTALGKLDMLPHDVQEALNNAMERTKEYDSFYLNVCMAYGSKSEVVDAVKAIGRKIKSGDIDPETITYDTIHQHLLTGEVPDPDLIIRTGGEARLSNFLLLQAAYAELFFTDVYLPAFRKIDFLRIIRDFQRRDRRYGV